MNLSLDYSSVLKRIKCLGLPVSNFEENILLFIDSRVDLVFADLRELRTAFVSLLLKSFYERL